MATVIFDFDSTLIGVESLEEILRPKLNAEDFLKLEQTTDKGMEGEIPFIESLKSRLSLTPLYQSDFFLFGQEAIDLAVPGMEQIVQTLLHQNVEVWIVSGAVRDCMLPLAEKWGLPLGHVIGVEPIWDEEGRLLSLGDFQTKWQKALSASKKWSKPSLAIGDGVTDWELYHFGLVDQFIAFTQISKRSAVLKKNFPEARDVEELKRQLKAFLNDQALLSS